MSHHLDTAAAREDGRLDLCDLYVFDGAQAGTTVFIMTVNPDAGKSSPVTFRPDALYEFKVDTDGEGSEDLSYRVAFGELDMEGRQSIELRQAEGASARSGADGHLLAQGRTGEATTLDAGGRLWAGLAADPFFADGGALAQFQQALFVEGQFDAAVFAQGHNLFAERDVTGIVLEVPTETLTADLIHVWATTSLLGHGVQAQVERIGAPLMQPIFNGDEARSDAHNKRHPRDDAAAATEHLVTVVATATRLAGTTASPEAYGAAVARVLLPDTLPYRPGTPAGYTFAARNGRRVTDDAMDVTLSLLTNRPLGDQVGPDPHALAGADAFPYLAPPRATDAPSLLSLLAAGGGS